MIKSSITYVVALLLFVLSFSRCATKEEGVFTVNVKYKNLDRMISSGIRNPDSSNREGSGAGTRIMLEEIPYGGELNPVILDSVTLSKNEGKITLKGNARDEGIFQLMVENGPLLLLINDEDNIDVSIDLSKRDNYYTISGSEASSKLKDFIKDYSEKTVSVNKSFSELDSLKQLAASDSQIIVSTGKKNTAVKGLNTYLRQFIISSSHPALSLFALGWSSRSLPQPEFEKLLAEVVNKFPQHEVLQKLKATYDQQKSQLADQQKKKEETSWVGKPAPELSLPTAEGNVISLASYRGKYLLVDFWASWCGPCRMENPNLVRVFNEFKGKNFEILGVSLDKEKDAWQKAIKDDQLTWPHVSDLKYWNSKAVDLYRFEGIPFNVLINPQGVIIAENLRGAELERKVGEVLQ